MVKQLRDEVIPALERVSGVKFDIDRLRGAAARTRPRPRTTWCAVLESRQAHAPRPSTATSAASTTSARSSAPSAAPTKRSITTGCCAPRSSSASPQGRARSRRTASSAEEQYRLVVEGPPNWTSFRDFWKMFYDEGAVVVASTYTRVGGLYDYGFRHDPSRPLEIARRLLPGLLHEPQPAHARRDARRSTSSEYQADGLLINSVKSCNTF